MVINIFSCCYCSGTIRIHRHRFKCGRNCKDFILYLPCTFCIGFNRRYIPLQRKQEGINYLQNLNRPRLLNEDDFFCIKKGNIFVSFLVILFSRIRNTFSALIKPNHFTFSIYKIMRLSSVGISLPYLIFFFWILFDIIIANS